MRAAILQTTTGIDPAASARHLVAGLEEARQRGADMAFTPEMSGFLDRDRARLLATARVEADDPVLQAARAAAARLGLWLHLGSLALKADDGSERLVNRGFVIDPAGAIRAHYDKIHLFDADLPSGETYRESAAYRAGDGTVVATTPWGGLGLSICYDLRFPALYTALSGAGATILSVPAAFTVPTGSAHWHVLLRARAIEAGAFVIAAAQTGRHEDGRSTYGHSLAIDPWGQVLLDMGEAPGLGIVDLDPALVDTARARVPAIAHRRPIAPPRVVE